MSRDRVRAQGVLFTTLVDFLVQIVFLLVLLLLPVSIYLDGKEPDPIDRLQPHVEQFVPMVDQIDWQDLELALVPKSLAQAYAAEPERLARDLQALMEQAGLEPRAATPEEMRAMLGSFAEKARKYDRLAGKPICPLGAEPGRTAAKHSPLLDLVLKPGGMEVRPSSEAAARFLAERVGLSFSGWRYLTADDYRRLFARIEALDNRCAHIVAIVADETPPSAKEEFKNLMQIIERSAYKQVRNGGREGIE